MYKEQATLVRKTLNNKTLQSIRIAELDTAIQMLKTYLNTPDIKPFLSSLETLKTDPNNEACQELVINAFNELGPLQGAALTYAPFLRIFVSDDLFGD
jgi:hypothetical protein